MDNSWMRQNEVDISRYLPKFLLKDKRISCVLAADSAEHELQRLSLQDLQAQFYLSTATWGLSLWEEFVGLPIDTASDYKTRRVAVFNKMNGNVIVMPEFLRQLINRYVADKTGQLVEHNEQYYFDVVLPDGKVLSFDDLEAALQLYTPAHLGWKYIAQTSVDGDFYIGGLVSQAKEITIPADTVVDITIAGPAEPIPAGLVSMGNEIYIPADLFN